MARPQHVMAVICLALVSSSALAAPNCTPEAEMQTATLNSSSPAGCFTDELTLDNVGMPTSCFDVVNIHRDGGVGCTGFGVELAGKGDCITGVIGSGNLTAVRGGGYTAEGEFMTGQEFTGTQSADNRTLTVNVDTFDCELTYILGAAKPGNKTAMATMADNATATATNETTAPDAATRDLPASSPAPTMTGSAAGALPSAVLLVLGAVLAFAF